ncbi:PREDICTED: cysteine-rich receptor-like protein kinase 14 isoform X1 [Camelina sativa]|uniref:Cysteine-rich receptor-like protein kinase 14 isoform X1 n=1 Tax=Camelina sativa TaxID=90675 RepID=A0ABM1QM78_CAMSA|nr:PREDICTED: cysteine-rich receptor-like protein kinase 14 isoform X1 [Camelina sativa]
MMLKMELKNLLPILWFVLVSFDVVYAPECGTTGVFEPRGRFDINRRLLLSSLASNVSARGGYFNSSLGQAPDRVYALGMCIQGAEQEVCYNCIDLASSLLLSSCPNQVEGLAWTEKRIVCVVRYFNTSFFGLRKIEPHFPTSNPEDITSSLPEFNRVWEGLTSGMIANTTSPSSKSKYYAAEKAAVTASQTIYALMQCTPDLSLDDCRMCLKQSVSDFQSCCNGKKGGTMYRASCLFRWDLFPFAEAFSRFTLAPPAVTNTTTKKDRITISTAIFKGIVSSTVIIIILLLLGLGLFFYSRRKTYQGSSTTDITITRSLQYDFKAIEAATNKFSENNVIGRGGFGEVFKGVLNGTEVAIKRLSKASKQGAVEFKNEVVLVAKLHHRNLVRLLGFCLEGEEKILVYEFVPNKSLDYFLFDPVKQGELDWTKRYNIIQGITRGILYLHQDSRLTIIHRDLKASNILLDVNMNPKIADFGMARIFGIDQSGANTNRIAGTRGYMPPEYVMQGQFSAKSDVYSYGVLVLEIICGKNNRFVHQSDTTAENLVTYAWRLWRNDSPLELVDPTIFENCETEEVLRCIHIALLCVQRNPTDRPSLSTINMMLTNSSHILPDPQQPGFFYPNKSNQEQDGIESSLSTNKSSSQTINDVTITDLAPR